MNFRVLVILLVVLFLFPIVSHSIPTENLMFEGQLLEYYKFKQTHNLLSRDATNSSLTRGHELKYERLLEEVTNDLLIEPSTKIPELITFIITERENGNSTGKYFIGLLDSLKLRLLDEDFSNMQYFRELERVILEPAETNSGYLSYLSEKTGDNEPLQDEEYTKWFNNKPWNQGLLKFYGDTLYFTRRFDKAIEIYNKILKTSSKDPSTKKYDSFYESEVRNKLASCHLIQKDYKKAIKEFYKASTLTDVPEAAVNQLFEAHSAIRMKKYKAAQSILNQIKSHKFLPESLYNSILIQEGIILSNNGNFKEVVEKLKKFEKGLNFNFVLKPDNKFVYKLLERSYRQIGNVKKMNEMREKLNSIPPLTQIDKLDPMVEEYDQYAGRARLDVQFKVDNDDNSWGYTVRMSNLIGASLEVKYRVVYYDSETGGLIETNNYRLKVMCKYPSGEYQQATSVPPSSKESTYRIKPDIIPGTYHYDFILSYGEGESHIGGSFELHRFTYRLEAIKFLEQDISRYHENYDDKNRNCKYDSDEDIVSNWNKETIIPDTKYSSYHSVEWSWADNTNSVGLNERSWPIVYSFDGNINSIKNLKIIPRFYATWGSDRKKLKLKEVHLPKVSLRMNFMNNNNDQEDKGGTNYIFQYELESAGEYGVIDKEVIIPRFPLIPGVNKYLITFTMYIDDTKIVKPMGEAKVKFIVSHKKPLNDNNYYLPLIEKSAKIVAGVIKEKGAKVSDSSLVRSLMYKLKELRNNVDNKVPLEFRATRYDLLSEDGFDNGLSGSINQFLDQYSGNGEAWANVLKQMAKFQGIDLKTVKFENYYGTFDTKYYGINNKGIPSVNMYVLNEEFSFPGIPREGNDYKYYNSFYQFLPNHTINILKDGKKVWLFDPSFYNPNTYSYAMQSGKFEFLLNFTKQDKEKVFVTKYNELTEFNEKYLSKMFKYFTILKLPCFNKQNKIFYKNISIPMDMMLTRPAYISFVKAYGGLSQELKKQLLLIKEMAKKGIKDVINATLPPDLPPPNTPGANNIAQKEIINIANSMSPGNYQKVFEQCEEFLKNTSYNGNQEHYQEYLDEVYVLSYIYSRAFLLFAAEEFEKSYHIPGWEVNKKGFKEYTAILLKQKYNIDGLISTTAYNVNSNRLDEYADTRYILAKYYQMAGKYDYALTFLNQVKDSHDEDSERYKNHYPWILWLTGETYTYQKDYENAIRMKLILLDTPAITDKVCPGLREKARYSLASDYLFSEKYSDAEREFKKFEDSYKNSRYVSFANLFKYYSKIQQKEKIDYKKWSSETKKIKRDNQVDAGFYPMYYSVKIKSEVENGEYTQAIEDAKEFLGNKLIIPNGYDKFYKTWIKLYTTGILVKQAEAYRLRGSELKNNGKAKESANDYGAAFEILDKLETDEFKDDNKYSPSKVGLPFPEMVYPVWGDDLGDYSKLAESINLGKKLDKTLKLRTKEYENIKVKYVNPHKSAIKFNRAMTYLSRGKDGDLEKARKLLEELAKEKKKTNRDFLITPVVGVDLFLIAISPQDENEYAKLAEDILDGNVVAKVEFYISNIEFYFDRKKTRYLPSDYWGILKNSSHFFHVKIFDIYGEEVPSVLYNIEISQKIEGFLPTKTNNIGTMLKTDALGKLNIEIIITQTLKNSIKNSKYIETISAEILEITKMTFIDSNSEWVDWENNILSEDTIYFYDDDVSIVCDYGNSYRKINGFSDLKIKLKDEEAGEEAIFFMYGKEITLIEGNKIGIFFTHKIDIEDKLIEYCSGDYIESSQSNYNDSNGFDEICHVFFGWFNRGSARKNNQSKINLLTKDYISAGGIQKWEFCPNIGASLNILLQNHSDFIYLSVHGWHDKKKISIGNEKVLPNDVQWKINGKSDIKYLIIAGCSILDIGDQSENFDGSSHNVSPGLDWAKTGPKYLLGYNYKAPYDDLDHNSRYTKEIIEKFMRSDRKSERWLEANRDICMEQFSGKYPWKRGTSRNMQAAFNSCAIDTINNKYYYFDYKNTDYLKDPELAPPPINKIDITKSLNERK